MTDETLLQALVIGIVVFVISVAVLNSLQSSRHKVVDDGEKQAGPESAPAETQENRNISPGESNEESAITRYTKWQMIFSACLAMVAGLQIFLLIVSNNTARQSADAAKSAAQTARDALVKTQKAFVFVDRFEFGYLDASMGFQPIWKNSGTTPTRNLTNRVNFQVFKGGVPDDFNFADLPPQGGLPDAYLLVPPQSTVAGDMLYISPTCLNDTFAGRSTILTWGHADYLDIFGKPHWIKYACTLILVKAADGTFVPRFSVYRTHNETDE